MFISESEVKFAVTELDIVREVFIGVPDQEGLVARIRQARHDWEADYHQRRPDIPMTNSVSFARVAVEGDAQCDDPMKRSEALSEHVSVPMTQDELRTFGTLLGQWLLDEVRYQAEEGSIADRIVADYAETVAFESVYMEEAYDLGPNDETDFLKYQTEQLNRKLNAGKLMMLTIIGHFSDDGHHT